jgi:hypothetical protein
MLFPDVSASELCSACSSRSLLVVFALMLPLTGLKAQEHDDDHDHDHLHFSHPMVTESPSPDTKIRLDYLGTRVSDPTDLREHVVRLEGEYAFNHTVSVAVATPFVWRTAPQTARASGLGDIEVSLKAASLMFGDRGLLLGSGLSSSLPTGNDLKGIGSGHIVELEPFVTSVTSGTPSSLSDSREHHPLSAAGRVRTPSARSLSTFSGFYHF